MKFIRKTNQEKKKVGKQKKSSFIHLSTQQYPRWIEQRQKQSKWLQWSILAMPNTMSSTFHCILSHMSCFPIVVWWWIYCRFAKHLEWWTTGRIRRFQQSWKWLPNLLWLLQQWLVEHSPTIDRQMSTSSIVLLVSSLEWSEEDLMPMWHKPMDILKQDWQLGRE